MLRSLLRRSAFLASFLALALGAGRGWAAPFAYVAGDEGIGDLAVLDLGMQLTPTIVPTGRLVALDARAGGTRLYGARSDALVVVDVTSNSVVTTYPGSGGVFNSVRLNPGGTRLYLPTSFGPFGQVAVFDASSGAALPAINTGGDPKDLVFHPSGNTAYVSDANNQSVRVIDVANGTVQSSVAVGSAPSVLAINPGGTRLYVQVSDAVAVFATGGMSPAGSIPGLAPTDVETSVDGTQLYVVDQAFPNLVLKRFDADSLTPTGSVVLGPVPGFGAPASSVAFDPSGARSYVSDSAANKVWVVDNASLAVIDSYTLASTGAGPIVVLAGPSPLLANPPTGSTLNFPNFTVGAAPGSAFIEFQNPGAGARSLSCQPPSSSAFTLINSPLSVPAAGSASLEIQFSSATAGSFSASLSCTAGSESFSYTLSATAIGDLSTNPASGSTIAFAAVRPGATSTRREIDFRNGSVDSISVTCPAPSLSEFSIAPATFTVPAFGNVRLRLEFASAAPGAYTDTLQCTLGTGGNISFPLTGQALAPMTSTPASGGTAAVRTVSRGAPSPSTNIVFQNSSGLANAVNCSAPTGATFSISPQPVVVPAAGSGALTVTMNTAVIGVHREHIECTDLAGARFSFDLSGRVVQPTYAFLGGTASFQGVTLMDTLDDSLVASLPLGSFNPVHIAVTSDASKAYVVDASAYLRVIDSATRSLQATIHVALGAELRSVSINSAGTRVYATDSANNTIAVIDTSSNSVIATVPNPGAIVRAVGVSPDGSRFYSVGAGLIKTFDGASNTLIADLPTALGEPGQVLVSPDGSRVIISYPDANKVRAIDANGAFLGDALSGLASGLAWQPDGGRFYVANASGLSAFDTQTMQLHQFVSVPGGARGIALHPSGHRAYLTRTFLNSLAIVDLRSMSVISTVPLGFSISAVGRFVNGPRRPISSAPESSNLLALPLKLAGSPATSAAISFQNPEPDAVSVLCQPLTAPGFSGPAATLNVPGAGNQAGLIQFSGNLAGTYTDTLSCSGSGGESFSVPVSATVVDLLSTTPASGTALLLPAVAVGASAPTVNLGFNNPNAISQDVQCSLSAATPFSLSSSSLTLPANAGGSLTVSVSTSAPGSFEDTLSCAGPLGQHWQYPVRAVVNGQITANLISGSSIVLAASFIGSSSPTQTLRFANSNPTAATLSCTTTAPASFGLNPSTLNINALSEADLGIQLIATASGSYSATLNCTGSGGEQFSYPLSSQLYAAPIAYVSNRFSPSLSLIDTQTRTTLAEVALASAPQRVAVHPSGLRALVTLPSTDAVAVVDAPGLLRATIPVGDQPDAVVITPDGRRALIGNFADGTLSVIDLLTLQVSGSLVLPAGVSSLALSADGTTAYAAARLAASVTRIDLASLSVAGSFAACANASDAAIDPTRNLLYLACTGNDSVGVYNLQTEVQVAMIAIGPATYRVFVHPSLPLAYALFVDGSAPGVRKIDTQAFVAAPTTTFGGALPLGMSLHPDGDQLLVTVYSGPNADRLSIRDAQSMTEIGAASTGTGPVDVALQRGPPNRVALSTTPATGSLIVLPTRVIGTPETTAFIDFQNLSMGAAGLQCEAQPAAAFSVLPTALTIPAMQTAALMVSFAAATVGTTGGTLSCSAFDGQPYQFGLSGTTLADQLLRDGFE